MDLTFLYLIYAIASKVPSKLIKQSLNTFEILVFWLEVFFINLNEHPSSIFLAYLHGPWFSISIFITETFLIGEIIVLVCSNFLSLPWSTRKDWISHKQPVAQMIVMSSWMHLHPKSASFQVYRVSWRIHLLWVLVITIFWWITWEFFFF